MANSDIIKIGFDYRASLAQFEKETNGVFDGISSKAGKQKITIQLDAKDDKVIDKIKELQKLKLDKFTFEFGNSGLKEQLQTFDKLENKINEIINLSKGIGNSSAPIVDVNKSSKEIDKLESKLSELSKKYEELQKKSATGGISGKEVNLVDNDEFKKLSQEVSELKGQFDDLKTHMSLLDDYTVPTDRFFELQTQVEATSVKVSNLVNEMTRLSNVQKNIGAETNISSGRKDAFSSTEATASVEKVADGFKEVKQEIEKTTESAKDYVRTISQMGEWNVDSKVNVVKEKNDGQLETWSYDAKRGKKDITYDKDGNINYGDPIITTISNYKQLEQTIVKADDKLRDLRKALEDIKEVNPNASTKNIEKQIQYQKEYISLLEQTVKMISQGDEYFLNEQQIIDARKKATTEYDLKQGTKSDISNAKQSAKANEQAIRQEQKLTDELRKQEEQARKTALSYTESASKKLSNAISKYSYGDSSDATAMMKQMNRGLSNFGDLSNIESNIKNFDSVVDSIITDLKRSHEDTLSSLNSEIKAEETMQKQKDAFNKSNLNAIDMEIKKREEETKVFSNSLKAQMESQQQAESQMSKFGNTLSKYQTKTSGYDVTIARFKDGGWTSDEYLKNVQAVENAVKKYEDLLSNIKAKGSIASEEDVQKLDKYEKKIKETIATVTNMSAAEKGYNFVSAQKELDKIHKLLNENSKMSAEAKAKIRAYYAEIESGNPSMSLDRIHGEIMKIYNAEVEAGRAGRSFFDTLKNSGFHQLAAQMAGMFGFYDVINLGKEAISTIVSLDDALVDLKKTTAMNSIQLEDFYYDANDVAKHMGVTTEEIITQASAWSRLGYSSQEAATTMAKLSSKFASISPGMSTDEAQEGLVSIMKAFDIDPDDVETEIMDKVNVLGNKFAEENQDVIEGLKRSAAAMSAMGQSFTDTAALFTGGMEILQDSESMGTALRTLSMRVRGYDEETNQLSDDLVNVTGEVADLTKTAQDSQGVSLFTDATQEHYRSMVEYLGDIADRWDQISEKNQTELLQKLFGKNRANAGAAIIQNFDQVRAAIEAMDESAGSSEAEMSAIESSLSYKINALKETWVGCVQDMIDRGDLGTIVTGLTKVSEAITFLLDKLGILGSIGLVFSGIKNVGRDKMYSLSF